MGFKPVGSDRVYRGITRKHFLQPYIDGDATGPLILDEVQSAIERLGETLAEDQRECVLGEAEKRAHEASNCYSSKN